MQDTRPSWAPLTEAQWGRAISPEPGDHEVQTIGGRYIVRLHDRSIIDHDAVVSYIITANTNKENPNMNNNDAHILNDGIGIAEHLSHDAQVGWLERYDVGAGRASYVQKVGAKAKTMKEARNVAQLWTRVLYDGFLGVVTLDTDPSEPGRPRQYAPGVPAVVLVEFPAWHPNAGEMAALYVVPTSSWLAEADPITGLREELADYKKGSGVRYVIETVDFYSIEDVDAFIELGRNAVKAAAIARRYDDASPEEVAEMKAEEAMQKLIELSRM